MKKFCKLIKKLVCIAIIIYAIITFCKQQKILNTYASNKFVLSEQINQAKKKQNDLNQTKSDSSSKEYIEEIAREKLDMYLSNERVYINSEN